jgi:DNA-binding HxlR family transcriptional regulator
MPKATDGAAMRGSRSGRPIIALLDLLGRRMALRLVWELHNRRLSFRGLMAAVETNPSVLNARLKELRAAGVIDHDGAGYGLTRAGRDLLAALAPLAGWADAWAVGLAPAGLARADRPAS